MYCKVLDCLYFLSVYTVMGVISYYLKDSIGNGKMEMVVKQKNAYR